MSRKTKRLVTRGTSTLLGVCAIAFMMAPCTADGSAGSAADVKYPSAQQISELRKLSKKQREYDARLEAKGFAGGYATDMQCNDGKNLLIIARDGSKLLVSRNGGRSWKTSVKGITHSAGRIFDIAQDEARNLLYIATDDGVYQSRDMAQSWRRFSEGLPYEHRSDNLRTTVLKLSLDPRTGDLYSRVALDGFGIYKTGCAKPAWRGIGEGLPSESITTDVGYCPKDGSVYIVNGSSGAIVITGFKSSTLGVFRGSRQDRGYTWAKEQGLNIKDGGFEPVRELVTDPNTGDLYACTYVGLFRKGGDQWQPEFGRSFVSSAIFEQGGTRRTIAFTPDKLYLRASGQWLPVTNTPWNRYAVAISAGFLRGSIYVSTNDGLYVSKDNCAHWARVRL